MNKGAGRRGGCVHWHISSLGSVVYCNIIVNLLFPLRRFWSVVGNWQDRAVQEEIGRHNYEVRLSWLAGGGDPAREFWWHVTELTQDFFRASPKWIREGRDLDSAKKREAAEARGLRDLAERQRKEEEKMRMLREVAELFKKEWPVHPFPREASFDNPDHHNPSNDSQGTEFVEKPMLSK